MMRLTILAALLLPAACAAPGVPAPSLAPRVAEAIDPRVPLPSEEVVGATSPALAERLAQLAAAARAAVPGFEAAEARAIAAASGAGAAQSESWITAQTALSALVAARAPVTGALSEIDALGARAIAERGGLSPADRIAIERAAADISAIDVAQAAAIDAIQARLAG